MPVNFDGVFGAPIGKRILTCAVIAVGSAFVGLAGSSWEDHIARRNTERVNYCLVAQPQLSVVNDALITCLNAAEGPGGSIEGPITFEHNEPLQTVADYRDSESEDGSTFDMKSEALPVTLIFAFSALVLTAVATSPHNKPSRPESN